MKSEIDIKNNFQKLPFLCKVQSDEADVIYLASQEPCHRDRYVKCVVLYSNLCGRNEGEILEFNISLLEPLQAGSTITLTQE